MEEKKFDFNSLIGFVLLGAIMIWWMYTNQPTPEELAAEKAKTDQVQEEVKTSNTTTLIDTSSAITQATDSLSFEKAKGELGAFAYSASLPSASKNETILENTQNLILKPPMGLKSAYSYLMKNIINLIKLNKKSLPSVGRPIYYSTLLIFMTFVGRCNSTGVLPVFTTTSPACTYPSFFNIEI